jgi:hypothetical protein
MGLTNTLHDLYRHQAWADAEHWRSIAGFDKGRDDDVIRKRLHHIHLVQYAFQWSVGDRSAPPRITTPDDFASFTALYEYGRAFSRSSRAVFRDADRPTRVVAHSDAVVQGSAAVDYRG